MRRVPFLYLDGEDLAEYAFEKWVRDATEELDGDTLLILATPSLCAKLDLLAKDKLMAVPTANTYGIHIKQWITAWCTVNIIKVPGDGDVGIAYASRPAGVIR